MLQVEAVSSRDAKSSNSATICSTVGGWVTGPIVELEIDVGMLPFHQPHRELEGGHLGALGSAKEHNIAHRIFKYVKWKRTRRNAAKAELTWLI